MDANEEIGLLFKNHNFSINKEDRIIYINSETRISIESRISQNERKGGCTSRLDIRIELPNGQAIIESFGDLGNNKENAKRKNIQNFAFNSFHVIAACINNCLLYTSPSPRDQRGSRMPSSA